MSSLSVGTQTPTGFEITTGSGLVFEFPDPIDFDVESDVRDGASRPIDIRRRESRSSIGSIGTNSSSSGSSESASVSSSAPEEPSLWNRCLRRLSSNSDILYGARLVLLEKLEKQPEPAADVKTELSYNDYQSMGCQLRTIADEFDRNRLSRTRSFTFLHQKKR